MSWSDTDGLPAAQFCSCRLLGRTDFYPINKREEKLDWSPYENPTRERGGRGGGGGGGGERERERERERECVVASFGTHPLRDQLFPLFFS